MINNRWVLAIYVVWLSNMKKVNLVQSKQRTTYPSRGFGSNQVDLGGIIRPASAISINSFSWTGYIAIAATQSSLHLLISSGSPLIPPTKSILSSERKSEIPSIGCRTKSVNSWLSSILIKFEWSSLLSLTVRRNHFFSINKVHSPLF